MVTKRQENDTEGEANRLLDDFVEKYSQLHDLIHHRESKSEQKKLEKDFGDVFHKDAEVQERLWKFVQYVNDQVEKNGDKS